MKKLQLLTVIAIFAFIIPAKSQDVENVKRIVKELASEKYHGRCYTSSGADKAAEFIQKEFNKIGLNQVNGIWYQPFKFDLNQISEVALKIDKNTLKPGIEYVVRRNSPSINGKWKITEVDESYFKDPDKMNKLVKKDLSKLFFVVDMDAYRASYPKYDSASRVLFGSAANNFIFLYENEIQDYVGFGKTLSKRTVINIQKKAYIKNSEEITFNIKTSFDKITTKNVMGLLPGSIYKDSIIIICGHYDHLGEMGNETFFPGADDNASAIGTMIELASYMSKENYPEKSILFVAFSGEEAGLLGSNYFVENLPIKKENINFVLNIDMIGFGESGIQIWNGLNEPQLSNKIKEVNKKYNLIDSIFVKENIPLSDHYPFTQADIDAVFLTTGVQPSVFYHTVFDTYENTPLSKTREIIKLISKTINADKQNQVN